MGKSTISTGPCSRANCSFTGAVAVFFMATQPPSHGRCNSSDGSRYDAARASNSVASTPIYGRSFDDLGYKYMGINTRVYHGYTMVFRTHLRYFQWGISDELGWFHVPVLLQFSLKLTFGSTVSDFRRAAGIWHEPAGDVWLPASSHPGNDTVMHLFGWSKVAN